MCVHMHIYIYIYNIYIRTHTLYKSNLKFPENRKLNVSQHLYQCSNVSFKSMPIYKTDDYTILQIKEKNVIEKFKPSP